MAAPVPGLSMYAICREFLNRRAGILKALTTDVDEFFKQCDPEKNELCLYGLPDRTWQVCPPLATTVPPELPEPIVGINFVREMEKKRWLAQVAMHSDLWLLRVALYRATFAGFNKESRSKLFDAINVLPTLHEVVTGMEEEKKEVKEVREARCAACGSGAGGDWILCSACQRVFHRRCVQQGKCHACSN